VIVRVAITRSKAKQFNKDEALNGAKAPDFVVAFKEWSKPLIINEKIIP
jgi:hypothetical protein